MFDVVDEFGQVESHEYTYYITDLRNNAIMAEVPMKSVTYSNKLSGIGSASTSVSINDETATLGLRDITIPGKSGLYIVRDGVPVWGGIIWKRKYDGKIVRFIAETFESYFYKRLQRTTKYWSNEDQLNIARWLVSNNEPASPYLMATTGEQDDIVLWHLAENRSAADLNIDISSATSPRRRERTMFGYEFKTVGEELEQLSALIDGFDWNVSIYFDKDNIIRRRLDFFYPQAGVSIEDTTLMFEYPGSIKSFTVTEDSDGGANMLWTIGAGEGTEQVTALAADETELKQGWPLLETTRSYKSVVVPSTLKAHAEADLERLHAPITIFEVEINPTIEPEYGEYSLGDWARFRIEDLFLTPPLDSYARITGIDVSVDDGSGLEGVKLTLGGEEVRSENV